MGRVTVQGNARARGVNPELVNILTLAARNLPWDVVVFSGHRPNAEGSTHATNMGVDVVLVEPTTGRQLPNYKSMAAYRQYEMLARNARAVQMQLFPQKARDFRWGGWFDEGGPDLMHFDYGGSSMALGNWDTGLNERGRQVYSTLGSGYIKSHSQDTVAPPNVDYGIPAMTETAPVDRARYAMQRLIGMGWTPFQAAAIVGHLQHESGGDDLPTTNWGDKNTSYGIAQWRGPRLKALQSFASSKGRKLDDLDLQLEFLNHELNSSERTAGDALRNTADLQSAAFAFAGFERPKGWPEAQAANNPALVHGWDNRWNKIQALGSLGDLPGVNAGSITPQPIQPFANNSSWGDIPGMGSSLPAGQAAAPASPMQNLGSALSQISKNLGGAAEPQQQTPQMAIPELPQPATEPKQGRLAEFLAAILGG